MAQVCVIGGGSFGSAMTCVAAAGIRLRPQSFKGELRWWVRRSEIAAEINDQRTNKTYYTANFDACIKASTDVREVAKDCDVCILALPSDFLSSVAEDLRAVLKPNAVIVSLIKSLKIEEGEVKPYTRHLAELFPGSTVAALMGPNLYKDMAKGEFSEATVGVADMSKAPLLEELFTTDAFHVKCISDVEAVDICGCLKNTFTLACGFAEGCGWGGNVRAAIIRRGLLETKGFLDEFLPKGRAGALPTGDVILEACGVGDLILSCTVGRGRQLASAFVHAEGKQSWEALEQETMGGMKIPDWSNVLHAHELLAAHGRLDAYPLLQQTYRIAFEQAEPRSILEALRGQAPAAPERRMRDPDFAGLVALVTGAANGIGLCIAERLSRLGAKVWAVDRDEEALRRLEGRTSCVGVAADLGSIDSLGAVVAKVGAVDLLVNAGGILVLQEFGEQTPEIWDATLDINARAIWYLTHELGKKMAENRRGSIVNMSSQSSSVAVSTKHMAYSTSKAAVDQITRLAAYALAKDNVRVNAVNPTVVRTALAIKGHGEEGLKKMAAKVPLLRICEPENVADAVIFLLSESSSMITGITLPVDGGFLCARP